MFKFFAGLFFVIVIAVFESFGAPLDTADQPRPLNLIGQSQIQAVHIPNVSNLGSQREQLPLIGDNLKVSADISNVSLTSPVQFLVDNSGVSSVNNIGNVLAPIVIVEQPVVSLQQDLAANPDDLLSGANSNVLAMADNTDEQTTVKTAGQIEQGLLSIVQGNRLSNTIELPNILVGSEILDQYHLLDVIDIHKRR